MNSPRCLLCEAPFPRAVWSLSGEDLRRLYAGSGRVLSDRAYGPITPEFEICLFECVACGFQYFDPALAGLGDYYAELEQTPYYPPSRPEFDYALRFCRTHGLHRVLDVGGGDGAFLDMARNAGAVTCGVELNPRAVAAAVKKGHKMIEKPILEVATADLGGAPDFISFFQVIEHVTDPRRITTAAAQLVRSGGYIMVSVPSRHGLFRLLPYDPANMPPHHVSRWREEDLRRLASACNLDVAAIGHDVLYGGGIKKFWLHHNQLAAAINRPPWPGGKWLPSLASFLYRKLGCRHYLPGRGLSVYAVFQRA